MLLMINRFRVIAAFLVGAAVLGWPAVGYAQTMSISVYNDAASNAEAEDDAYTLYGYSSVDDNSSGCGHSGYFTTTHLTSPSSRHNSTGASGLSSGTSLGFDGEEGSWSIATSGSYQCSCIFGGTAGFGGSASAGVAIAQTHRTGCYGGTSACVCPYLACTPGTAPTCGIGPINMSVKSGPCTTRMVTRYLRLIWDDDDYVCTPGFMRSADGPSGACY
jgi:hypothetical protein